MPCGLGFERGVYIFVQHGMEKVFRRGRITLSIVSSERASFCSGPGEEFLFIDALLRMSPLPSTGAQIY